MTDLLTPDEAAPIAGAPAEQLARWAWLGVGPPNAGTKLRPKYREEDLRAWSAEKLRENRMTLRELLGV